jgi:hypothetical protein
VSRSQTSVHGVDVELEASGDRARHGAEAAVHVADTRIERIVEIEDDGSH